jgi:divinyl protochlorophyllide a 8-vinyl-reductase
MSREQSTAQQISSAHHNRVGPNAVIQIQNAMIELGFGDRTAALFIAASAYDWIAALPTDMVDETRVALLHHAVRTNFPHSDANAILKRAGELTGIYILENRIPKFAQLILKFLPKNLAARILTKAIAHHAWTFAGSGKVITESHGRLRLIIRDNPFCRHEVASDRLCVWHEAVLATLYHALISPDAQVREVECQASGHSHCLFEITV